MQIEIEAIDAGGNINPELYINRELSWIEFNRRVLDEARDPRNPLLERIKFAAIFSSNLDEFFMVRVSGVKEQIDRGVSGRTPNGFTPSEQYAAIRAALLPLVMECQDVVCDDLLPALAAEGIVVARYTDLNAEQRQWLDDYYLREIFPVLTPLVVDPTHRFPFISNLSLSLAVVLDVPDAGKRFARVKVPQMLPRLVMLPQTVSQLGTGTGQKHAPEHGPERGPERGSRLAGGCDCGQRGNAVYGQGYLDHGAVPGDARCGHRDPRV